MRDVINKRSLRKKTAFFSGTTNFFGPSYFEVALVNKYQYKRLSFASALTQ